MIKRTFKSTVHPVTKVTYLFWYTLLFCFFAAFTTQAMAEEIYFLSTPTVSPDAKTIVFSFEGDLWRVACTGGTAFRLTGMDGSESNPRFSPDGRWLAFSGTQDGNNNVYVMPVGGGEITQLTFHDQYDIVDSWSWDSNYIYFYSNRYNSVSQYKVSRQGGTPQRLIGHYFNRIHNLVEHPITHAYYFTDSWESLDYSSRKGYKGDYNPDIISYDPRTQELKYHTTYRGKDFSPTIDRQGTLYFVSDRFNEEFNLFCLDAKDEVRQLTSFDTSIKSPQVSANGELVVFEKDYQIFTYINASNKVEKVNIQLPINATLEIYRDFNVEGNITFFDVSPDGKKLAFVSRGRLFVSDIQGKYVKELNTNPKERVLEVKWLEDSRSLIYNQTDKGWLNLFKIKVSPTTGLAAAEKEEQLTFDTTNNREIELNPKKTQVMYLSGASQLKILDLKNTCSRTIVTDEFWAIHNSHAYFSPGGDAVVYTAYRNFEGDIFIYYLADGKIINLMGSGTPETEPFWSPDGKYLYFVANRFHPFYPSGSEDAKIYRLPFQKYLPPFRSTEFEQLFSEEEKDKDTKAKKAQTKGEKKSPEKNVTKEKETSQKDGTSESPQKSIGLRQLYQRWELVSPSSETQGAPYVIYN